MVCADGGARWPRPDQIERIVGDGDSVPTELAPRLEVDADPNLNDLQKVLKRIDLYYEATCIIGLGFLGKRWDHSLTNLNELPKHPTLRLVHEQQILSGHVNDCQMPTVQPVLTAAFILLRLVILSSAKDLCTR